MREEFEFEAKNLDLDTTENSLSTQIEAQVASQLPEHFHGGLPWSAVKEWEAKVTVSVGVDEP